LPGQIRFVRKSCRAKSDSSGNLVGRGRVRQKVCSGEVRFVGKPAAPDAAMASTRQNRGSLRQVCEDGVGPQSHQAVRVGAGAGGRHIVVAVEAPVGEALLVQSTRRPYQLATTSNLRTQTHLSSHTSRYLSTRPLSLSFSVSHSHSVSHGLSLSHSLAFSLSLSRYLSRSLSLSRALSLSRSLCSLSLSRSLLSLARTLSRAIFHSLSLSLSLSHTWLSGACYASLVLMLLVADTSGGLQERGTSLTPKR